MTTRRSLVVSSVSAWVGLPAAFAQQRRSLTDPLRMAVDVALIQSGLAQALQKAFGRDTGIAVRLVPGASLPLLEALERGEFDAALTNAPDAEAKLDQQGLVHDRHEIARGAAVLIGPAPARKQPDPAGIAGLRDVAQALQRLRDAAVAHPGSVSFLSAGDTSGLHAAEQNLWRAAQIAPAAPWYATLAAGRNLVEQARATGAYALVEQGAWTAQGGKPLAVLVADDPRQSLPVHVMRSFRVSHPAAKIFVTWIVGPKGRRVVASQRGYRTPV